MVMAIWGPLKKVLPFRRLTEEAGEHEELEEDVGHVEQLGHEVEREQVAVLLADPT